MRSTLSFVSEKSLTPYEIDNHEIYGKYAESQLIDAFLDIQDDGVALKVWLDIHNEALRKSASGHIDKKHIMSLLGFAITAIDNKMNNQLNSIIHSEKFKKLEASWRGVKYLVDEKAIYDKDQDCKVKLLHLSWKELSRDCTKAIEFDQSDFFRIIYNNEFNMPGGEPFNLLIGDYKITHKIDRLDGINDIDVLRKVTQVSAAAFAPFITSAEPSFMGVDTFSELASVRDINEQFSQMDYINWNSLREMDDSKFLGITLPDILMRAPYKRDGSRREKFYFHEVQCDSESDFLWGNAAYAFGAVCVRAFCESGWFSQIRGVQQGQLRKGVVVRVPYSSYCVTRRLNKHKMSVNLQVGDKLEKQLADSGFIPISTISNESLLTFYSNASVNTPKRTGSSSDIVNARLASMLQYILCVSRFAHYIKVICRDKVGGFETEAQLNQFLQSWILNYTSTSDDLTDELLAKYPLNEAQVRVKEIAGKPGHFYSVMHLRPHFQLDQMVSNIRLITELSPILNRHG
ncbi:type VI secretion protein [Photobacterium jeanii]|uniref:Type VI secretion protein n=1 Tax=Photobacterium jeanii TaxID=858640 RepID=A0A178K2W2_9GAMM|nr:type VI secretion system contractile sheath large subunit [Photobacterium jeanii]OAN11063.1 type VI secretion protein [Photobacterium jeanii]PST90577.1 type VI secretion system contractile sheath large subunit [Photobacterium jeanii]